MKFASKSVARGWQTIVSFEDQPQMEYPVGPVFTKCSDLWEWQQRNLPAPIKELHPACPQCLGTGSNLIHPQSCASCEGTGRADQQPAHL
jgi:hypothetical protein